jgi:hypothetical protein
MPDAIQLYKRAVLLEARQFAKHLEAQWPDIFTEPSLDTREGEDAYVWVTASEEARDAIRDEAVALTVDLYEEKAMYIVVRFRAPSRVINKDS